MQLNDIAKNAHLVSIDSRTIKEGDIFLAIKGTRFDGHDFVKEAFTKGARLAIVSRQLKVSSRYNNRLVKVNNTIQILGDIAKMHRQKFDIPVIAITGSNGKTTAKDMVAYVLSSRFNVVKNETSKNNLIGLPLTLLQLEKKHDIAVLEMGMSRLGEIDRLSQIAKPNIGVITNIGPTHLEFLKTMKNIFIAKSELLKRLPRKGLAVLNKDDIYLRDIKRLNVKKIYFGIGAKSHFQATGLLYKRNKWHFSLAPDPNAKAKILSLPKLNKGKHQTFESPLFGRHNIYNALIAIAVARQFRIDFSTIRKRIKTYKQPSAMRLEFKNVRGIKILNDSYNSNPLSMECAIDTLIRYNTDGKKIIVSGDMLELGGEAKSMHEDIGRKIAATPIDVLITMGRLSKFMNKGAKLRGMSSLHHQKSYRETAGLLRKVTKPGDVVLIKGSRAMEMEKVIEAFKKK